SVGARRLSQPNGSPEAARVEDLNGRFLGDIQQVAVASHQDISLALNRRCQNPTVVGVAHRHGRWCGGRGRYLLLTQESLDNGDDLRGQTDLASKRALQLPQNEFTGQKRVLSEY